MRRLQDLNFKSSVGLCPMSRFGATIGEALGYENSTLDSSRVDFFRELVTARVSDLLAGRAVADDIKVFVKPEPHSEKKMKEGRYRLISAVSMVDTMVDRIIFGDLTDRVLDSVGLTPVMIGWTPIMGGYRLLRRKLPSRVVCIDKSSWDWTVPYWMTRLWLDIILGLCNESPPWWQLLVKKRFEALFETAVFQFSDGTRVFQEVKGIMKSGCYLTIVLNSIGQLLLHYMVADELGIDADETEPICMGDDTVQRVVPDLEQYVAAIERLGFLVKEAKEQNWIEFAGFYIDDTTFPVYHDKHLYRFSIMDLSILPEAMQCYQMLYADEPGMLEFIHGIMRKHCPEKILPRSILRRYVRSEVKHPPTWVGSLRRQGL